MRVHGHDDAAVAPTLRLGRAQYDLLIGATDALAKSPPGTQLRRRQCDRRLAVGAW